MGEDNKRKKGGDQKSKKNKKSKFVGPQHIEPNWFGLFVTCMRGREAQCKNEMSNLLSEYIEKIYGDEWKVKAEDDEDDIDDIDDIEAAIAKELGQIKDSKVNQPFTFLDLGCECVLFFRLKKPINPVKLVKEICVDAQETKIKKVRYTQRLIPVSLTDTANEIGLERLAKVVLKPEFHDGQEGVKFAVRTEIRNHHILNRDTIIPKVAEIVGRENGHKVDLKQYDKLIIVNCFKSSLGIAVVDQDFEKLKRFNLQQIFEESVKVEDKKEEKGEGEKGEGEKVEDKKEVEKEEQGEQKEEKEEKEV